MRGWTTGPKLNINLFRGSRFQAATAPLRNLNARARQISDISGKIIDPIRNICGVELGSITSASEKITGFFSSILHADYVSARLEAFTEDPANVTEEGIYSRFRAKAGAFFSKLFPGDGNGGFATRCALFAALSSIIVCMSGCEGGAGVEQASFIANFLVDAAIGAKQIAVNLFTWRNKELATVTILSILTALGIKSGDFKKEGNPHSISSKFWSMMNRARVFIGIADISYLTFLSTSVDSNFIDIFLPWGSKVNAFLKTLPAALLGYKVVKDIRSAFRSRMSAEDPITRKGAVLSQVLPDLALPLISAYLVFRGAMFGAMFVRGANMISQSPSLIAASIGLAGLVGTHLTLRLTGLGNANRSNNPVIRFLRSKWAIRGAWLSTLLIDPNLTFFIAANYVAFRAMAADVHSSVHAGGLGVNEKISGYAPAGRTVSDQQFEEVNRRTDIGMNVINPYIKPIEVNVSHMFKIFVNQLGSVEHELCIEQKPLENLDSVRTLRATRILIHQILAGIQTEIAGAFHSRYASMSGNIGAEYARFIEVLEDLGERLTQNVESGARPDRFARVIREHINADRSRLASMAKDKNDRIFDDEYLPQFEQALFMTLKHEGNRILKYARRLRQRIEEFPESKSPEELRAEYIYHMRRFTMPFNIIVRREVFQDDQTNQKTNNVAFVFTHWGDTLYKVWRLNDNYSTPAFRVEYIPSLYIRINNPGYDFKSGTPAYYWVDRRHFSEELRYSGAASNEIEYLDNTPDKKDLIEVTINGRTVEAYPARDDAPLPFRGFVFRGDSEREMVERELVWACGQKMPEGFEETFRRWAGAALGGAYNGWLNFTRQREGNDSALWWEDSPSYLSILGETGIPEVTYLMNDEEHMGYLSPTSHTTHLLADAENNLLLRLTYYDRTSHRLPNPVPGLVPERLGVADSFMELSFNTDSGQFTIPLQWNRATLPGKVKFNGGETDYKDLGLGVDPWRQVNRARAYVDEAGNNRLALFNELDPETPITFSPVYPRHLPEPKDIIGDIDVNVFVRPLRVGNTPYLIAEYPGEGPIHETQRFARLGKTPFQFWPNLIPEGGIGLSRDGRTLHVENFYPLGCKTYPVPRGWLTTDLRSRVIPSVRDVDGSGRVFIARITGTNRWTWAPRADAFVWETDSGTAREHSGAVALIEYQNSAGATEQTIVPVNARGALSTPAGARSVIDGEFSPETGELTLIHAVRAENLNTDTPDYLYRLRDHLRLRVPDVLWITDVKIEEGGRVRVYYTNPHNPRNRGEIEQVLEAGDFIDNEGMPLLSNPKYGLSSVENIYQRSGRLGSTAYPRNTGRFRPRIETRRGKIYLVVTPVRRNTIPLGRNAVETVPDDIQTITTVQYAVPTSAVRVETPGEEGTKWIPLSLTDQIKNLERVYQ